MKVIITTKKTIFAHGKKLQLEAITEPGGGNIVWSSSDDENAPVNQAGLVTGNKVGTYTITANCEGVTASVEVQVLEYTPTYLLQLDRREWNASVKDTTTLVATVAPEDNLVTWTTSDPNIVTVKNGYLTAKSEGICLIQAQSDSKTASCRCIISPMKVTSVKLNTSNIQMGIGGVAQLQATTTPLGGKVRFSVIEGSSVTVDSNGKVNGVSIGRSKIRAYVGDVEAFCTANVYGVDLPKTIKLGNNPKELEVTTYPENSYIEWESSNPEQVELQVITNNRIKLITHGSGGSTIRATIMVNGIEYASSANTTSDINFDWITELTPELIKSMTIYNTLNELMMSCAGNEYRVGEPSPTVPKLYYIRIDKVPNTFNYRLAAVQEDIDKWQLYKK